MTTRCCKLNNPGSIIISTNSWLGKVVPSRDEKFETFDSVEHGIRALAKTLLTYYRDYNLTTVDGIITRWAPAEENDTRAYIQDVNQFMGIQDGMILHLLSETILASLVGAIIHHEQGANNGVTEAQINRGVEMALT